MLIAIIFIGMLTVFNTIMILYLALCIGKHHHGGFTEGNYIKYRKNLRIK